jgi:hypothetical protein
LTIVLVLITDIVFGDAAETVTMWSLIGSGYVGLTTLLHLILSVSHYVHSAIMAAFGVLVYDMYKH